MDDMQHALTYSTIVKNAFDRKDYRGVKFYLENIDVMKRMFEDQKAVSCLDALIMEMNEMLPEKYRVDVR